MEEEKIDEALPVPEKEEVRPVRKTGKMAKGIHDIMGGDLLSKGAVLRNLPFLIFLAIIALFYIANTYYAEKTFKDIERTTTELKELRYRYVTAKSTLLYYSKQTEIAKRVEKMGIGGTTIPPYKIFYSREALKKQTDSIGIKP